MKWKFELMCFKMLNRPSSFNLSNEYQIHLGPAHLFQLKEGNDHDSLQIITIYT